MVLISLLIACLKPQTVVQSSQPVELPSVFALQMQDSEPMPTEVQKRLEEIAKIHNVTIQPLSFPQNIDALSRDDSEQNPLLIIDTQAIFYAQVNGRFRWEVNVDLVLRDGDVQLEKTITIPVFHQFHHQREAECLEAALPTLERELHSLLNTYLSGR